MILNPLNQYDIIYLMEDKVKNKFDNKEPSENEAYPEEMLIACLNGKPCSYGICDECPITNGYYRSDEDDDEQNEQE